MNGSSRHGSHPETKGRPAGSGPGPDSDRLIRLLEPVVHAMNMDLESIRVSAAGRRRLLRIVVDADGGVSLDDIALASRELSATLDRAAAMGEQPYTLEVTSPGVDRPLTEPKHWRRAVGRLVSAPLTSRPQSATDADPGSLTVTGRVTEADARGVRLDVDGESREYGYSEIGAGRIQIEFA